MSDRNLARRAEIQIAIQGVNVTTKLRPYLLSLTFTDNEEDQVDDLQVKLQDRDGNWLLHWIADMIDTAAESTTVAPAPTETAPAAATSSLEYRVTARTGLNVRSGPGTNYARLGTLASGSTITVLEITNGWAKLNYSGKTGYASATYLQQSQSSSSGAAVGTVNAAAPQKMSGCRIQADIVRLNWNSDGADMVLECGQFELDTVDVDGPPDVVTLKATALPYSTQIRQTKKSKVWENYTLEGIANEMASANGMGCMFLAERNPKYDHIEQRNESDVSFLSALCHNAGISLKFNNNILVLYDQASYESKQSVLTIKRGGGIYDKFKLHVGTADTQYSSCRVSYAGGGSNIEAIAKVEDYKAESKNNQQLEITAKVASIGEAQLLAEKMLRMHNKYAKTATFTLQGNPDIHAGLPVALEGWGHWDGKYMVKQAKHSVGGSGYTTQVTLRKTLEGY